MGLAPGPERRRARGAPLATTGSGAVPTLRCHAALTAVKRISRKLDEGNPD
ncbi:MAG: hypothetical protein ABSC41_14775 [Acidimicrobiales bacterium]